MLKLWMGHGDPDSLVFKVSVLEPLLAELYPMVEEDGERLYLIPAGSEQFVERLLKKCNHRIPIMRKLDADMHEFYVPYELRRA